MSIPGDYFRYFPDNPDLERWGVWVAASGIATIPAGSPYPPPLHPGDHHFEWKRGRVLESLQILLISSGSGWFETRSSGKQTIGPGTAFLVLPGLWHRYRPDPSTGWQESWIELRGRVIEDLLGSGALSPTSVLQKGAVVAALEEIHHTIHRKVCGKSPVHRPELSAEALRALSLLTQNDRQEQDAGALQSAVTRAEQYLAEHHAEALDMQDLSRQLGVSYTSFRRAFRKETGLSPWQYLLSVRLNRARRLLSAEGKKLEEVASAVGFSSAFHLSGAFKKTYGISPNVWRKQHQQGGY